MSCKKRKKPLTLLAVFCLSALSVLAFAGCNSGNSGSGSASTAGSGAEQEISGASDIFTDRDKEQEYDESQAVTVTLADGASSSSSSRVTVAGDTITFTGAGVFVLSGSLSDGQLIVNAGDDDKVELVLNGVNVNCNTSAALYVKNADKVFVTLNEGAQNFFSNKQDFIAIDDNNIDSVIFAKDDVVFKGAGSLKITAVYGHGIVGKDDVKITGGTYDVTAAKSAVSGKDSVCVGGGSLTLQAGKDGIHAENSDDETLGYIYIQDGEIDIDADDDGMDAVSALQIDGGTIAVTAEGKGIKATGNIALNGGSIEINSTDDAVHSNSNITYAGGEIKISTTDDGFHADDTLTVRDGKITVEKSYEGLEGENVIIGGGEIEVTSTDDGINAAGGNDQSGFGGPFGGSWGGWGNGPSSTSDCAITVTGGMIKVNSSAGDGIDSNGAIYVSGGVLVVSSNSTGNSCLDSESGLTYTGGTVIGIAPQNSMWTDISGRVAGNYISNVALGSVTRGSVILVCDKDGNVLAAQTSTYGGSSGMVYMDESLTSNGSYTFVIGATYNGELNDFGYGTGGSYSGGTSVSASFGSLSSGGGPGGTQRPGGRW